MTKIISKPLLRWAGGKSKLIKYLVDYLPNDFKKLNYIEPFFGAGSLFFATAPTSAIISDLNPHLINFYKQIKENPKGVFSYLEECKLKHSKEFYYYIRKIYNSEKFTVRQAAIFLYLNKTSFNGIFRVNKKGCFNVPFGKEKPAFPSLDDIILASKILKNAEIMNFSYENIISYVKPGAFVYLDPPYPPLNGTAYFTHYTKERFSIDDQKQLCDFANILSDMGCKVLITNADTSYIKQLYKNWNQNKISVIRWITSKSKKYKVNELVITNY